MVKKLTELRNVNFALSFFKLSIHWIGAFKIIWNVFFNKIAYIRFSQTSGFSQKNSTRLSSKIKRRSHILIVCNQTNVLLLKIKRMSAYRLGSIYAFTFFWNNLLTWFDFVVTWTYVLSEIRFFNTYNHFF